MELGRGLRPALVQCPSSSRWPGLRQHERHARQSGPAAAATFRPDRLRRRRDSRIRKPLPLVKRDRLADGRPPAPTRAPIFFLGIWNEVATPVQSSAARYGTTKREMPSLPTRK